MFENIFDKIYLINLDRRKDRYIISKKNLDKYGIIFERFNAIDGNLIDNNTILTNGALGCLLSHYEIIKKAYDDGLECIAILEDDLELVDNFNEVFNIFYKEVPSDWQFLYLGCNKHENSVVSQPSNNILRIVNSFSTAGYAVRRKAMELILRNVVDQESPIDVYYGYFQTLLPAYTFKTPLLWQRSDWSDIENKFCDYKWLFERNSSPPITKTVGVVIVCYGDKFYLRRSLKALSSVINQTVSADEIRFVYVENGKLHTLINDAVRSLSTDYFIRLDADDFISEDYIQCFKNVSGDIIKPYVIRVDEEGNVLSTREQIPDKPLNQGNHIVSTAPIRRDLFLDVGGYNDHPVLEDYDLFIRLSIFKSAKINQMEGTLYYTQRSGSRNTANPDDYKYNNVLIEKYFGVNSVSNQNIMSNEYKFF